MPTSLTALLGALVHDARAAAAEPTGVNTAAALLVHAAGSAPLRLDVEGGQLLVNTIPVDSEVPGARTLLSALESHRVGLLVLPAGLDASTWREFGELLASGPGLYPTSRHVRAALDALNPGITFVGLESGANADTDLAAAVTSPSAEGPGSAGPDHPDVTSSLADRSTLSTRLDPLLADLREAVARRDWHSLAGTLLGLETLESGADLATRSIVALERRRTLPQQALIGLVKLLTVEGGGSGVEQAVTSLGIDGAAAIVERLNETSSRAERSRLVETLGRMTGIDELLIRQLGATNPALVVDIAAVVGNRSIEAAIPALARQLGHRDESVRAACWRALEDIGTLEALTALERGRR